MGGCDWVMVYHVLYCRIWRRRGWLQLPKRQLTWETLLMKRWPTHHLWGYTPSLPPSLSLSFSVICCPPPVQAIDEAAKKIEEILRRSREEQSGVSLEVNSRILDSCTELMKAIQVLILRSKELQQEIVTEGAVSLHYSTMHMCVCVCVS